MKAVTVHRGSRDGYQVARALSEAGLLETLVTDLYWPGDRPWARKIEQRVPGPVRAALNCRRSDGLPSRAVESCWFTGMAAYLAYERHWLGFDGAREPGGASREPGKLHRPALGGPGQAAGDAIAPGDQG